MSIELAWKSHDEAGSRAEAIALGADRTAVCANYVSHDVEAQPEPARGEATLVREALESQKDAPQS